VYTESASLKLALGNTISVSVALTPAEGKPAQYLYGSNKFVPVQTPHGRCLIEFTGRKGCGKGDIRPNLQSLLKDCDCDIPKYDPQFLLTGKIHEYCKRISDLLMLERFRTLIDTNISDAMATRLYMTLTAIRPGATEPDQDALANAKSWLENCLSAVIWSLDHCENFDPNWKTRDYVKVADIKILSTTNVTTTPLCYDRHCCISDGRHM
jgi:hypothetical protein